jgi:NitT/TauT family transport system substrate-binding protein
MREEQSVRVGRRTLLKGAASLSAIGWPGLALAGPQQIEISVTQWGASLYGLPYAVGMEHGLFKQAGVDVTGVIGSGGGGTTVRNTLAAAFPYGEVSASAALAAKRSGLDIVLVNMGAHSVAEASLVVPINSPLRSVEDLVGKKVGITTPRSVSEMLLIMVLQAKGIDPAKVERVVAGGYGQGLTMLDHGAVVAASLIEPLSIIRKDQYRPLVAMRDVLPPMATSFGIVPRDFAKKNADLIKAIIAGRRSAVQFIYGNETAAGQSLAKAFDLDPQIAAETCKNMVTSRMWSEGNFNQVELNRIETALRVVGEITDKVDWDGVIDKSYLPDDLRGAS